MGSSEEIKVYTDHKNLEYYQHPRQINARVAHYIPRLANYYFKLIHKPGTQNHADALSQCPDHDNETEHNSDVVVLPPEVFANATSTTQIDERVMAQQLAHQATLEEWANPSNLCEQTNTGGKAPDLLLWTTPR